MNFSKSDNRDSKVPVAVVRDENIVERDFLPKIVLEIVRGNIPRKDFFAPTASQQLTGQSLLVQGKHAQNLLLKE